MTQVAEPRSAAAGSSPAQRISHWIGGRPVAGTSGRDGPVFDPATGRIARRVDFASSRRSTAAVRAARAAFPAWRATSLAPSLGDPVPDPQPGRRAPARYRRPPDRRSTARSPRTPSARSPAGSRTSSSPAGSRRLLKGGFSEQASTGVDVYSIRQPLGRRGRDHPVQLPGDGPDVDVRQRDRLRQHLRPQAVREGPFGARCYLAELLAEAGLPEGVFNVVHGDRVAVDRILEHPDIAGGLVRRFDPGGPPHLRDRDPRTESASRRSAGRRTT